jgi:hypothetical protein
MMGKTWKIHPKHRKKGTIDLRKVEQCINECGRKASRFHHFHCGICWSKLAKNRKLKVKNDDD